MSTICLKEQAQGLRKRYLQGSTATTDKRQACTGGCLHELKEHGREVVFIIKEAEEIAVLVLLIALLALQLRVGCMDPLELRLCLHLSVWVLVRMPAQQIPSCQWLAGVKKGIKQTLRGISIIQNPPPTQWHY